MFSKALRKRPISAVMRENALRPLLLCLVCIFVSLALPGAMAADDLPDAQALASRLQWTTDMALPASDVTSFDPATNTTITTLHRLQLVSNTVLQAADEGTPALLQLTPGAPRTADAAALQLGTAAAVTGTQTAQLLGNAVSTSWGVAGQCIVQRCGSSGCTTFEVPCTSITCTVTPSATGAPTVFVPPTAVMKGTASVSATFTLYALTTAATLASTISSELWSKQCTLCSSYGCQTGVPTCPSCSPSTVWWIKAVPQVLTYAAAETCVVAKMGTSVSTGSGFPASADVAQSFAAQALSGTKLSFTSGGSDCGSPAFTATGSTEAVSCTTSSADSNGYISITPTYRTYASTFEGTTTRVRVPGANRTYTPTAGDTLASIANKANTPLSCLLVANPQIHKPQDLDPAGTILTVPPCLTKDNITEYYASALSIPWASSPDLNISTEGYAITQTAMMQVFFPIYQSFLYTTAVDTDPSDDVKAALISQINAFMASEAANDLFNRLALFDPEFGAYVGSLMNETERYNVCQQLTAGSLRDCYCDTSNSILTCLARTAAAMLQYEGPQEDSPGGRRRLAAAISPNAKAEPFPYPYKEQPDNYRDLLTLCPTLPKFCTSAQQCAREPEPPENPSSPSPVDPQPSPVPEQSPDPVRPSPSPNPYKCSRNLDSLFRCQKFSLSDANPEKRYKLWANAFKYATVEGCIVPGSCTSTSFGPFVLKVKPYVCPVDKSLLGVNTFGFLLDGGWQSFLNKPAFEKTVNDSIALGMEICLVCTGNKELDNVLDWLDAAFSIKACLSLKGQWFVLQDLVTVSGGGSFMGFIDIKVAVDIFTPINALNPQSKCNCPSPDTNPYHCLQYCLKGAEYLRSGRDNFWSWSAGYKFYWWSGQYSAGEWYPKLQCDPQYPPCSNPRGCLPRSNTTSPITSQLADGSPEAPEAADSTAAAPAPAMPALLPLTSPAAWEGDVQESLPVPLASPDPALWYPHSVASDRA